MDVLHSSGLSSTYYLQTHFSHSQGYFLSVSKATDLRNTFFLLFPIWFYVRQADAIRLVWVAVVGDWINLMLKWLLFGERPYWWVQETGYYGNTSQPMIEQFPMTCETGPGSPSGHAMGAAAVYYTMMSSLFTTVLKKEGHQIRKWCVRVSLWTLFWCVQLCVCLSRVFVAAHFPHQVITGVFIGFPLRYPGGRSSQPDPADLQGRPVFLPPRLPAPPLPGSPPLPVPPAGRRRPPLERGESAVLVPPSGVGQRGHQPLGQLVQKHWDSVGPGPGAPLPRACGGGQGV
ncbi:glucose-6-phosphatase-like isoform X3 [Perca fluviatilis]|uniref:glucose-6-phosphatase-like isoform X3 n=1 Tax=Perca fluviatilis TaxID=8168 RepID=UPI001962DB7D|nr:glucose-6-phosphatase-like isoform X3 [Perca fluviatilis]